MNSPNRPEKAVRLEILRQAELLRAGETANYFHEPETTIGRELLAEGLIIGSAKTSGGVGVTGIRDAGRAYLKAQRPGQKIKNALTRAVLSVSVVAIVAYIFSLDSVKATLSSWIGRFLK